MMHLAEVHTTNFYFQAIGEGREGALQALRDGWAEHLRQYAHSDPDPELIEKMIVSGDVKVISIESGVCYRDGERLAPRQPSLRVV